MQISVDFFFFLLIFNFLDVCSALFDDLLSILWKLDCGAWGGMKWTFFALET